MRTPNPRSRQLTVPFRYVTSLATYILNLRGGEVADRITHPFNEAGRRLKAAMVSKHAGYVGVDYTLKRTPEVVEEYWAEAAQELSRRLIESAAPSQAISGEHSIVKELPAY